MKNAIAKFQRIQKALGGTGWYATLDDALDIQPGRITIFSPSRIIAGWCEGNFNYVCSEHMGEGAIIFGKLMNAF